jgi:WD40 repeat protein
VKEHKGYTHHVAWSRDGKWLVVAGGTSGFLTLWDVTKPDPIKTSETGKPITGIAFGPDPKLVAVSGTGMGVQVWDLREAKTPLVMVVPSQNGSAVAWSPDGKTIAGGSATKTFVWDAENGKEKQVLDTACLALAFNPAGEGLAVSTGANVKVWSALGKDPKALPLPSSGGLAWSGDGAGLFAMSSLAVQWHPGTGKDAPRTIDVAADFPVQLTPGTPVRPLITGFGTSSPQLWDTSSCKLIATLEGHTGGVTTAAWSRDGKMLATGSADKTIRLWDATGKAVRTLSGHEGPVACLAWGEKALASGSSDRTVRLWHTNADLGKIVRTHKGPVAAVAWSKDGKQLASGDTQHIVLAGPPEGDKLPSLTATEAVQALAWAPSAKALAVGLDNGNVEVFAGVKLVHTLDRNGSPPNVTSLMWSPDGNALLAGRANHTAQVWPSNGGKALFDLACMAPVLHVGWSPGGHSMVISASDRSARVFDLSTGHLRGTVVVDRKQLAVVSGTGNYRVADEATCELVYVVQTAKGQETLTPKDAREKFKFRNAPASVSLMDK